MATNKIYPFAQDPGANVLTDAQYAALTALLADGFLSGIASSAQMNKVWRQSSVISAAVAQFMADNQATNIDDSLTIANLATYLKNAINGAGTTQAQFDNTTKMATTAFVKGAQGNTSGLNSANANANLTLGQLGNVFTYYGSTSGQQLSLPDAAIVPAGYGYWVVNQASVPVALKGSGAQNINANTPSGASAANTMNLSPGDSVFISSNGASTWNCIGLPVSTGSFTITGTGFAVNPTATATYKIINGVVILTIPTGSLTGTSNAVNFTLTGLPAAIQPSAIKDTHLISVSDNGSGTWAEASVSGSVITLNKAGLSGNWTASGTKKLWTTDFVYTL